MLSAKVEFVSEHPASRSTSDERSNVLHQMFPAWSGETLFTKQCVAGAPLYSRQEIAILIDARSAAKEAMVFKARLTNITQQRPPDLVGVRRRGVAEAAEASSIRRGPRPRL